MTFPDLHLAGEAIAALVDGELSPGARTRAVRHLMQCDECRRAVRAQREASGLLAGSNDPNLSLDFIQRLRDIPMSADTGLPDSALAMKGEELYWSTTQRDQRSFGSDNGKAHSFGSGFEGAAKGSVRGHEPAAIRAQHGRFSRGRRKLALVGAAVACATLAAVSPHVTASSTAPTPPPSLPVAPVTEPAGDGSRRPLSAQVADTDVSIYRSHIPPGGTQKSGFPQAGR